MSVRPKCSGLTRMGTQMARKPLFNLRVEDDVKSRWQQAAEKAGENLSDFVRTAADERAARVMNGAQPPTPTIEPEPTPPTPPATIAAAPAAPSSGFRGPDWKPVKKR